MLDISRRKFYGVLVRCLISRGSLLLNGYPGARSGCLSSAVSFSISSPLCSADPSFQVVRVVGVGDVSDVSVIVTVMKEDVFSRGVVLVRERRGGTEAFWRIEHSLWRNKDARH
jgi:hypothetical protein